MDKGILPESADKFVPHRPPMLLIEQFVERSKEDTAGIATATAPSEGLFMGPDSEIIPEYFIELIAQTTAAINGYDALVEGNPPAKGFLVGIDKFVWKGQAVPGEKLRITAKKIFEFGAVAIIDGFVYGETGNEIVSGKIKVWEESD